MARTREELQVFLETVLGGSEVYFQPPPSVQMRYPAIVYTREKIGNRYADNLIYAQNRFYLVTVIDRDPDSEIVWRMSQVPGSRFDRHYHKDNLNHDVFTLYW